MKKSPSRKKELSTFSLGSEETQYLQTYSPDVLEAFDNRHPSSKAWTSFVCTEFTSLCPKTGQPDFAKIFINYIARDKMVESKSMKIYLFGFRNHGDFHEDCIQTICDDLCYLLKPHYLEVVGEFTPRGGIAIFPFAARHDGSREFKQLHEIRFQGYAPGRYSMPLQRLY
jgi:7-cyano-7-deazaguanine reductase